MFVRNILTANSINKKLPIGYNFQIFVVIEMLVEKCPSYKACLMTNAVLGKEMK